MAIQRLALLVCVLSGLAQGQLTPKEASAQLKAASAATLKVFKVELKLEVSGFQTAIAALQDKVDAGTFVVADFEAFCADVGDFQSAVAQRAADAIEAQSEAVTDAWGGMAPEQYLSPPDGFQIGDGGTTDKFRAGLRKAVEKSYASLTKKLHKLGERLAEKADARMAFRLVPPLDPPSVIVIGPLSVLANGNVPLDADYVFALTDGESEQAHFGLGGTADAADGLISCGVDYGVGACFALSDVGAAEGRWNNVVAGGAAVCVGTIYVGLTQGDQHEFTLPVAWPGLVPP